MTHEALGMLTISGVDAKKFLQGQLTCNMDEIGGQLQLGAHCNPQGRIISFFHIFHRDENYFLIMSHGMIPIAMKALQKYAVFFKVTLKDDSENPLLQELIPFTSEWKKDQMKQGIPAIYPDTSEKFLPHELNLPALNAVSFNKGCFTGQEIIARMHYKGKLKTHLYQGKSTTRPLIGAEIYSETGPTGFIVDSLEIGYNNYELLFTANETDTKNKIYLDPEKELNVELL